MKLLIVPVTPFMQNCSVLVCERTGKAVAVDPGGDLDRVEAALRSGVRAIRATYIPSEKNGVVAGLYESLGFKWVDRPAATAGASHWELQVNKYIARRTFLERRAA